MSKEIRILYVEDVPADVVMVNHELRRGGLAFRTKRVDSKDVFLHELTHDPPDLILSDHGLPSFDGFTALAIARDKCPDVPFIFVTSSLGEEMTIETFESGATDYVLKNNLSKLVPAVQRALREVGKRNEIRKNSQILRESEERFRRLVEGVKDHAIFILDTDGRVTSSNSGAQWIHGYRPEEVIGRALSLFYQQTDVDRRQPEADLNVAATAGRFEVEGLRINKAGKTFWANVVISALHDANGKLCGFAQVTRDITERRRVQDALNESEIRKAAILDTALDAIISINHKGVVQEWNQAAHTIFGYRRNEALGREMAELIIPASLRQAHREGLARFLATGDGLRILGQRLEMIAQRTGGEEFPVELSIVRVPDSEPPVFTAFLRDITLRKGAEEALRHSEAVKAAILDSALDAILSIDHLGQVQEWNPAAQRIFGYSRGQALGQPLDELIIPMALREVYQDGLTNYLMTGVGSLLGRPIELTLRRANNTEFRAELVISRVAEDQPVRCTALIRDITEHKQNEAALQLVQQRFRLLVEGVRDYAIYMLDVEGRVVTWNAGAEHIERYRADEILGQHLSTFFTPEDVQRGVPEQTLREAEELGEVATEGWRIRKDGSRFWSRGIVTALRNETGKLVGFSKIAHDITKQKQSEEEIRRLNRDLEQRVRDRTAQLEVSNKELEAFSYSVSHDLRAPLRHIMGYVEILQTETPTSLDGNTRQHLQTIADSARMMGGLIDALLAFSHMGRAEMRWQAVSLNNIITEALRELHFEIEGRAIDWQIGALGEVQGDALMLRQVMANLLSNALKYTRTRSRAVIEIGAKHTASETLIFVRDNGVGFDMEYADKLFGVFQRLHRAAEFEGTGIGLANVRRIINRHGGRAWAEGAVDGGATFYFSLPKPPGEGGQSDASQMDTAG